MDIRYKIRFLESFKDGNLLPKNMPANSEIEVDEQTYLKIRSSGGKVEVLDRRIPNPMRPMQAEAEAVLETAPVDASLPDAPKVISFVKEVEPDLEPEAEKKPRKRKKE